MTSGMWKLLLLALLLLALALLVFFCVNMLNQAPVENKVVIGGAARWQDYKASLTHSIEELQVARVQELDNEFPGTPPQQKSSETAIAQDYIVAFLTHSVDGLQLPRVQELHKQFPGQFRLVYDGPKKRAMNQYPDLEPWQIVCSADPNMSLVGTMFLLTKQLGSAKSINLEVGSKARSHEVLYSWLLLTAAGQRVKKVLAIENDVHYTDIATLSVIFDRFCKSSVDLLYQEPGYLVYRNDIWSWKFMLTERAVFPAAVFEDSESYQGMLNLFGLSRNFLRTLDHWIMLNEGRLTFDEPLLASLAVKYGLDSACWQHWLGGNVKQNSGLMRWRPTWTWKEMNKITQDVFSEFLDAGLTPHGLFFHPVKAAETGLPNFRRRRTHRVV